MPSLNKVMLIGHAGKDSELRYLANGTPQAKFSLATNHNSKKGDQWESQTEWHNIVIWGDTAERVSQYIVKGKQMYIEGRIQTRNWESDDGQKHYMTEVIANTVQLLDRKEGGGEPTYTRGGDAEPDDLPFFK
jgi:single-strand DNA-binding protein